MKLVDARLVQRYVEHDSISALMDDLSGPREEALVCQKWLRDSAPKRFIFEKLYGDLLRDSVGLRVLDVGGGLTCFTRLLAERHKYHLIDLMAHADESIMRSLSTESRGPHIHVVDWYDFQPNEGGYDIVVANDLFPNVDQRLALFLDKILPISGEVRLSLTYYPDPRFYVTRRVRGDEYLCMLAWDGETTAHALERFVEYLDEPELELMTRDSISVYPNGRQVCLVKFVGKLAEPVKRKGTAE
ncbi:MAG: hypothetical protein BMS9Abin05_2651 [Rhodothermia bacterium]|nr:MAG: hypothetical protein BMS9Abin05_2651 [Rhodothermia bacterium]